MTGPEPPIPALGATEPDPAAGSDRAVQPGRADEPGYALQPTGAVEPGHAAGSDRVTPGDGAADPAARSRRELRVAVLLCLAGGALALLAGGRVWVTGTQPVPPPLPPRSLSLTAAGLRLPVRDLALLGLAAVPALLATRRTGRLLVGLVAVVAGAAIATLAVRTTSRPAAMVRALHAFSGSVTSTGWPLAALLAGVLLAAGGILVALRGRRWAALSARYDAPAVRAERPAAQPETAAWDALDRGEDPTRR